MPDPTPDLAPTPPPEAKLTPPEGRGGLIDRPALMRTLEGVWSRRMTLVAAPAGSGKTTSLAAWARRQGQLTGAERRDVAWLTVEPEDADPWRFWSAVVFAIRRVRPDLGLPALSALVSSADPVELALPGLLAELGAQRAPIALVIDDLHLVGNPTVHRGLGELLARLPPNAHVVISTRVEPPVGVGRLRAHGELMELGADQLRLQSDEATDLLRTGLGIELREDQVARLTERTEGWAAGLYLAGLSMRDRGDPGDFIDAFAGDDRHVVDYLGPEVIDAQPEAIRDFLVRTSVLDRLSGELCDAVLDSTGSATVLAQLERSNLFLIPLDARRRWFRFHRLFRDLLADRLERDHPGEARTLHRRAAAWLESNGDPTAAIPHALAGGDTDAAARLVATVWLEVGNRGWMATVASWLGQLPDEVVEADPRLSLARAWTALTVGTADDIEPWLAAAERRADGAIELPGASTVESSAAMARAMRGGQIGDVGRATAAARRAVAHETAPDSPGRARACAAYGLNLFWSGASDDAERYLEEALAASSASGQFIAQVTAAAHLALIELEQGDPDAASDRLRAGEELATAHGLGDLGQLAVLQLAAGRLELARDDPRAGVERLERAITAARTARAPVPLAAAQLELARAHHRTGDHAAAAALLESARAQIARARDPGVLVERLSRVAEEVTQPATPVAPLREDLTDRELEVLRLLPSLRSQREIADELFVSHNTVKTHLRGIYRKLGASSRTTAVSRARELGLLDRDR